MDYTPTMRIITPSALRSARTLEPYSAEHPDGMPLSTALELCETHSDDISIKAALREMSVRNGAEDLGVHWALGMPGLRPPARPDADVPIWPVRVVMVQWAGERWSLWLMHDGTPRGGFVVRVRPAADVIPGARGLQGRERLLRAQDESETGSPASGVSP